MTRTFNDLDSPHLSSDRSHTMIETDNASTTPDAGTISRIVSAAYGRCRSCETHFEPSDIQGDVTFGNFVHDPACPVLVQP